MLKYLVLAATLLASTSAFAAKSDDYWALNLSESDSPFRVYGQVHERAPTVKDFYNNLAAKAYVCGVSAYKHKGQVLNETVVIKCPGPNKSQAAFVAKTSKSGVLNIVAGQIGK